MGQFSFLDCVTGEQILCCLDRPVYVLIPSAFGGGHEAEEFYGGYGVFGDMDIYEAVAIWNKNQIPEIINLIESGQWHGRCNDFEKENLWHFYKSEPFTQSVDEVFPFETRTVGIIMACHDDDNVQLKYPIKITYDADAVYENCAPSKSDPNQGWYAGDDDFDVEDTFCDGKYNSLLWDILKNAFGHQVEIAIYGDPENPANICLEDLDTNEVLLDAELYTLCCREDDKETPSKTGHWVKDNLVGWKCSECGEHIVLDIERHGKFCPNCGVPMRNIKKGEQND